MRVIALILLFLFAFNMRGKSRHHNSIGEPAPFSRSKLPTYREMAQQWHFSRLALEAEQPGTKVKNADVADRANYLLLNL